MVDNKELYADYTEASHYSKEWALPDTFVERFEGIEAKLYKLWHRDPAEWVSRYYRQEYRKRRDGERDDPVCQCPNPRCCWKQGDVAYQLRRRETTLTTVERTPMEQLKMYLKRHPDAVVIEEARDELQQLAQTASSDLTVFIRDAREYIESDESDIEPNAGVPMANEAPTQPALSPPSSTGGR